MATRKRAWLDGDLVTIIDERGTAKNSDTEIRDAFGFTKIVKRKELSFPREDDKEAKFDYAGE